VLVARGPYQLGELLLVEGQSIGVLSVVARGPAQ
jgi:hypothetical protein